MIIFLLVVLLIILVYFFITKNHDYWKKRNVKHDPPVPFFGNHFCNIMGFKSIAEISNELYNKYPEEKVVGYYRGRTPTLIVRDLDIVKHILNVDFAHFYPRGLGRNANLEPLFLNLFHANGDTWKLSRKRLTAAFTTAKLKAMFPLIIRCAEKLQLVGENIVLNGGECDIREIMARFTTEFIGACGFGIEMDTINNEHSLFRNLGKRIFTRTYTDMIIMALYDLFPEFRSVIQIPNREVSKSITEIFLNIRNQRDGRPSGRNDFIDLLLDLESKGKIYGESVEKLKEDGTPMEVEMEMDLKLMTAQVFIFFAAGFETSSSATSFTLHQLAYHPEIQEKIQDEIDDILLKYNNKLSYDTVAQMPLLAMAFKEAMRIFPSLAILNRVCAKRYTIEDLGITIDPGVKIIVPIQAIQNDEKYFENPTAFRPERFSANEGVRHKYAYLPFGEGPRACIGARLGEMQSLAGLAAILQKFTVEPAPCTRREIEVEHRSNVVQGIIGGLPLKLKLRKTKVT
ncbi:hypothetical protein K1T71_004677 [Dendrolimus kikuchii]|uniref:Uncharacterized protein n=1 Tax=Dendrolimus kikuchii TaxID=765133 RepID=A0ACC1D851_9NEOP|nr:hypothetical protein K1T71_004677 [Dendrolimus kikuchii]